jgi:acyl-coenzyme A thioesterase PaaI-like protein
MKAGTLRLLINLWPPFLFSGIRGTRISPDFREAEVSLHPRWYNRNYVGTHFGGSLFAMTDPWYMLLLIRLLGREYLVWDQKATIEFVAPGRGTVRARFRVDDETLAEIVRRTQAGEKYLPEFSIDVKDEAGQVVARVHKTLYVRRKQRTPAA